MPREIINVHQSSANPSPEFKFKHWLIMFILFLPLIVAFYYELSKK